MLGHDFKLSADIYLLKSRVYGSLETELTVWIMAFVTASLISWMLVAVGVNVVFWSDANNTDVWNSPVWWNRTRGCAMLVRGRYVGEGEHKDGQQQLTKLPFDG